MIITPKRPRKSRTGSRLSRLVPYMLKGKGGERCTWYMAGNLEGLDRREDAELALSVMQLVQDGNVRAKGDKTYHVVISFHPNDRKLTDAELSEIVRKTVARVGLKSTSASRSAIAIRSTNIFTSRSTRSIRRRRRFITRSETFLSSSSWQQSSKSSSAFTRSIAA